MRNLVFVAVACFPLAGCWAFLGGPSESRARAILEEYRDSVEKPAVVPREAPEPEAERTAPPEKIELTLEKALLLATRGNRDFLSRKEDLVLAALDLASARYDWDPQMVSTISYLVTNAKQYGTEGESSGSVSGSVSQKLPFGGSVKVEGGASAYQHHSYKDDRGATTTFSITWDQPILRGFGPDPALENLVQSKRNLMYELREFEVYRQRFALSTLTRFFSLVSRADVVRNSERNAATYADQYRRAQALLEADRMARIDVLRAERETEQARNDLEIARDLYDQALDDFKVYLGLHPGTTISLSQPAWISKALESKPGEGSAQRHPFRLKDCIAAALANRLEIKTTRDRFEDAKRAVSVAGNGMLPDLDFTVRFYLDHPTVPDFGKQSFERHAEAGFTFGVPWDHRSEHDAFLKARIAEERARRTAELADEQIRQEVVDLYRRANQARLTLHIQNKLRDSAEMRLKIARYRFEEGEISNREVLDANDALLLAENRYVEALVERNVLDLELSRAMGILTIAGDGSLTVLSSAKGEAGPGDGDGKSESGDGRQRPGISGRMPD